MKATEWPWITDQIMGRVFMIASSVHAGSNAIAFLALYLMTRGNGEGKVDSPAIETAFTIWQGLGVPLAWTAQMLIDPNWRDTPSLIVQIVLRIINSLVVGIVIACLWAIIRRQRMKKLKM